MVWIAYGGGEGGEHVLLGGGGGGGDIPLSLPPFPDKNLCQHFVSPKQL